MFEEVIQTKRTDIYREAYRKDKEINYIAKVAKDKDNYPILLELFGKGIGESNLKRVIFEKTGDAIISIEDHLEGTGIHHEDPSEKYPVIKLGWVEAKRDESMGWYFTHPSEKGLKILNKLRNIRGQISFTEKENFEKYSNLNPNI